MTIRKKYFAQNCKKSVQKSFIKVYLIK